MVEFVTKEQARISLRLDSVPDSNGGTGPDDPWLNLWIPIVSAAVLSWLKDSWRAYVPELDSAGFVIVDSNGDPIPLIDSNGDLVPHPSVVGATILELASQYRYREGEGDNQVPSDAGYGYVLSRGATALLTPLRRSTVA